MPLIYDPFRDPETVMKKRAKEAREAILFLSDSRAGDSITRMKKVIPTVAQLFKECSEWLERDDVSQELMYKCFCKAFEVAADALASLRKEASKNKDLMNEIRDRLEKVEAMAALLLHDKDPRPRGVFKEIV